MTKILFVRHGESIYNKERKFTGQKDIPLTELGEKQAQATGAFLLENYQIDCIYSSDLCRAVRTALPVAQTLGLSVQTDKRFREIHLGDWTDEYIQTVKAERVEEYAAYCQGEAAPNGESRKQLRERVLQATLEVVKNNPNKTVLITSHGGAIRAILSVVAEQMNVKLPISSNASVSELFYDGEKFTLGKVGMDEHLKSLYSMQDEFLN